LKTARIQTPPRALRGGFRFMVRPSAADQARSDISRQFVELSTLADVRDLVDKHLPEQHRRKPTWRHVSTEIAKAAEGEKDLLEICVSLRLVLALEGVDCLVVK
jgi:hypothetical protein